MSEDREMFKWIQAVIASHRESKDARPSGRAMAKQPGGGRAPYGLWIAASAFGRLAMTTTVQPTALGSE